MALTSPAQLLLLYSLGCIHSLRPMSHYWWLTLARLCTRRVCLLKYSHVWPTVRFTLDVAHLIRSVKKRVDCATVYLWRYSNEIQTSINTNQHSRPEVWKIVSWVQGYHKSRRKHDIYVRLGLKRRCVFHNSCKTGKDFEAEADNWTMEKHSRTVLRRADVCTKKKAWIETSWTTATATPRFKMGSKKLLNCTLHPTPALSCLRAMFSGNENTDNW